MKKFIVIAIWASLFYSCGSNEVKISEFDIFGDFTVTTELTDCEIVTSDLLAPSQIVVMDSLVFINEWQLDPMMICYDMKTQTSKKFLRKGRGPGETSQLLRIYPYGDSMIQATVDPKDLFIYNIDNVRDAAMPDEIISLKAGHYASTSIAKTGPESVIYIGKDPENPKTNSTRFCIYDYKADLIHCFGEYPSEDKNVKNIPANDFSRQTAYQGDIIVRPDGNKAVAFYVYAVGFDIIDIKKQEVIQSKFYQYPLVVSTYISQVQANVVKRVPDSYRGFLKAFCNNDHIYFLYSDKTFEDTGYNSGRHILKYDWNGNPVCRYILNEDVDSFTVDESEKNIYVTKMDEDAGYLIIYPI